MRCATSLLMLLHPLATMAAAWSLRHEFLLRTHLLRCPRSLMAVAQLLFGHGLSMYSLLTPETSELTDLTDERRSWGSTHRHRSPSSALARRP